ncbi:uncharacterized protein LOC120069699 [Benincasa hispida]|uniref:uncharacterized protein LOC120069699 n=1 Tax=Benincasa hispida TaxID=102211 RepID=UPI0018FF535D|nr:uncharacterized protein LOC120069699 [Benincasa hispida]
MGCGISRLDPKEVVEATTNCSHNPPHPNNKFSYSTSNCFTGESKPWVHQHGPPSVPDRSSPDWEAPEEKIMKMKMDVKRGESKEMINDSKMAKGTRTQFEDDCSDGDDGDGNDGNGREICRGGSPSFREYCIDSESRSRSMASEDDFEGDHCKWPPDERMLNSEKEKGGENEMGKKERKGKGIRKALQRGKSGGVKNFLSASRRQQQQQQQNTNFPSSNNDTNSHKLHAKAS